MNRTAHKTDLRTRTKTMQHHTAVSIDKDCDTYQPHAPRRIKDTENHELFDLQWDKAGNLGQRNLAKEDGFWLGSRHLFWTEDNRMHAVIDASFYSHYTCDQSGERTLKLVGKNNEMDVNAEFQHTAAVLDHPTLYPSPYVVLGLHGYTKHYYAGTERICAKIGGGFNEHFSEERPDLQETANTLFAQSRDDIHHRELPQNDLNCVVSYGHVSDDELNAPLYDMPNHLYADAEINLEWFHHVVERCEQETEEEDKVFFYHSDHLGSASWITNRAGDAIQHLQYLPFGTPFVNQYAPGAGYQERFTFTGKELDSETGYGYHGARFMDYELLTCWLSEDPLADKYPNISPYHYCSWNPVKLVDPNGQEDWEVDKLGHITKCQEQLENPTEDRIRKKGTDGWSPKKQHIRIASRNYHRTDRDTTDRCYYRIW